MKNHRLCRWIFIDKVKAICGDIEFIAEDLGFLTPVVHELCAYAGWTGMKILQFAFDPSGTSIYLPHMYDVNCICYTGTHDNEMLSQWWNALGMGCRTFTSDYLGLDDREGPLAGIIQGGMSFVAAHFICPMQDWLGLGPEGWMNVPGLAEGC